MLGWILSLAFAFGWPIGPPTASVQQQTVVTPPWLINASLDGRDTFEFYCAPCHGRQGRGDGPIAKVLKTPPADLTKLAAKNRGVFPRQAVEEFVTSGRAVPAHGSSEMPVWGPTFRALESPDEVARERVKERIANVVKFIESLQAR